MSFGSGSKHPQGNVSNATIVSLLQQPVSVTRIYLEDAGRGEKRIIVSKIVLEIYNICCVRVKREWTTSTFLLVVDIRNIKGKELNGMAK